jgi:hypothetical protein
VITPTSLYVDWAGGPARRWNNPRLTAFFRLGPYVDFRCTYERNAPLRCVGLARTSGGPALRDAVSDALVHRFAAVYPAFREWASATYGTKDRPWSQGRLQEIDASYAIHATFYGAEYRSLTLHDKDMISIFPEIGSPWTVEEWRRRLAPLEADTWDGLILTTIDASAELRRIIKKSFESLRMSATVIRRGTRALTSENDRELRSIR